MAGRAASPHDPGRPAADRHGTPATGRSAATAPANRHGAPATGRSAATASANRHGTATAPAASTHPALDLQGVTRLFGTRTVLDGVDLAVAPGERVVLRGANGSGKTTLLRVAATVLRPSAGSVAVAGVDARAGHAARRHLRYVPQDAPVLAELTPAEHLRFAARLHGASLPRDEALRLASEAGLGRHATRPAATLSRGQRQRLALALALAIPLPSHAAAPLLLLDEPATALDAAGRDWLAGRLEAWPGAVLAAAHDDMPGASRTVTLTRGRLQ